MPSIVIAQEEWPKVLGCARVHAIAQVEEWVCAHVYATPAKGGAPFRLVDSIQWRSLIG